MAHCVAAGVDGVLSLSSVEPCTTFVIVTPAEYAAMSVNPFNLTPEDGTAISFAIVGVWVTALCIRALIRVVRGSAAPDPGDGYI